MLYSAGGLTVKLVVVVKVSSLHNYKIKDRIV